MLIVLLIELLIYRVKDIQNFRIKLKAQLAL